MERVSLKSSVTIFLRFKDVSVYELKVCLFCKCEAPLGVFTVFFIMSILFMSLLVDIKACEYCLRECLVCL